MPAKLYSREAQGGLSVGGQSADNAPPVYFLTDAAKDGYEYEGRSVLVVTSEDATHLYIQDYVTGMVGAIQRDLPRYYGWDLTLSEERARRHLEET